MFYRRLSLTARALVLLLLVGLAIRPAPAAEVHPTLAVLGLHAEAADQPRVPQLTGALHTTFRASKVFNTLSEEVVERALSDHRAALREEVFIGPARRLRQEARVYAEEAQFSKAVDALHRAEERLLYYREHLTSNEELFDILQQRAQLYLGLGREEEALRDLRRLAALTPERSLDPLRFPPQVLERYARLRIEAGSATADLEVNAEPKIARVYLDGALRGTTPLVLKEVPLGRHFIRLEDPETGVFFQDLNLTSGGLVQVFGRLAPPELHAAPDDGVSPELARQMLLETYLALGRKLQVDYLPLASLDASGLEVQLLHIPTGQPAASYATAFGVRATNVPQQLKSLVTRLETLLTPAGTLARPASTVLVQRLDSNLQLQRYLFDPVRGSSTLSGGAAGRSSKPVASRPLTSRTWFWAVVGGVALSAAGGATYAVLSREDNTLDTLGIQFNLPTP